jgi:hypothetical protein
MFSRKAFHMAACAALLCGMMPVEQARAQGAPFTIRRPPDGATVREKVTIEIPSASMPPGASVAIYLDGNFYEAVPGNSESFGKPFRWIWDTKGTNVSDGEHTLRVVLYTPSGDSGTAVEEKGTSEVKLNVANKIHNGPSSLRLRYRYADGQTLDYQRTSTSKIVGGVSNTGVSSDQTLASIDSRLMLEIESPADPEALVRNKLTALSILQQGQETTLDSSQLSESMYQMLDPLGVVHYEYGANAGTQEFAAQGLPVDNSLELPRLPTTPVSVGQTWTTPNQRLDIPGVPVNEQPKVTLNNTLADLEWEDGYPTARIHQTYDSGEGGGSLPKFIQFGPIPITSPQVKFDRDIYIAYTAGRLIRTMRTITVTGRTTAQLGASPSLGAGGGMAGMPAGMMQGKGGGAMRPGMNGGMRPGMSGGPGGGRFPGGIPGSQGRFPGGGSSPGGGFSGFPGGGSSPGGGFSGFPGGGSSPGGGFPGFPGGGGFPGGAGGRFPGSGGGFPGGAGSQEADHPVTVKAITDTQLNKVSGP